MVLENVSPFLMPTIKYLSPKKKCWRFYHFWKISQPVCGNSGLSLAQTHFKYAGNENHSQKYLRSKGRPASLIIEWSKFQIFSAAMPIIFHLYEKES